MWVSLSFVALETLKEQIEPFKRKMTSRTKKANLVCA
jgi:hypothetical protein